LINHTIAASTVDQRHYCS